MRDAAAYRDQLLMLLPPGKAFSRDPDSVIGLLAHGLADELARLDARADVLYDEADPRTTLELLPDWERVAGLPDTCTGRPDTIAERQVALANKIASLGGQSIAYFTLLAARLGYYVEIDEFRPIEAGFGAGDAINGDDWAFAWQVAARVDDGSYRAGYAEFVAGSSAGDLLLGWGALNLECLINRARPAHTTTIFAYTIEPEASFWFDFIGD